MFDGFTSVKKIAYVKSINAVTSCEKFIYTQILYIENNLFLEFSKYSI